jgi:hypothetical protein
LWPVRGHTLAQSQPRFAKLTVRPEASLPLPCTHTRSWKSRGTWAIALQPASKIVASFAPAPSAGKS